MKFTLFVFLAGLCLVVANTKVKLPVAVEEHDYEYIPNDVADDTTDYFAISPWLGIFFVIQKVLTTLKGVNCTIKEVLEIRAAAQAFVNNVKACGGEVSKKLQQLIDTCNNIISTSNDIIHAKTNICGDTDTVNPDAVTLASRPSFKCFWNMLIKTMKLKYEVKKAIYLISKIPSEPSKTTVCVKNAANSLANVFQQFPTNIRTCSKLVS